MLTKYEYFKLKERYKNGYRWIARNKDGELCVYKSEPIKLNFSWRVVSMIDGDTAFGYDFLFPYIKWEDEKPTLIADLINEYEANQVLKHEPEKVVIPDGYTLPSDEWFAEHPDFPNKMNTNHNTNVIIQNRGTGKTTHAIITSSKTGATIITHNVVVAKLVLKQAEYLGCNIPKPMSINQYFLTPKHDKPEKIIIDELDLVLGEVLDSKIELITISK